MLYKQIIYIYIYIYKFVKNIYYIYIFYIYVNLYEIILNVLVYAKMTNHGSVKEK